MWDRRRREGDGRCARYWSAGQAGSSVSHHVFVGEFAEPSPVTPSGGSKSAATAEDVRPSRSPALRPIVRTRRFMPPSLRRGGCRDSSAGYAWSVSRETFAVIGHGGRVSRDKEEPGSVEPGSLCDEA